MNAINEIANPVRIYIALMMITGVIETFATFH